MSEVPLYRCEANVAHVRQSRSDSGLGFQAQVRFQLFPLRSEAVSPFANRVLRPYPEYSRDNSYPWSPFPPEAGPS